MTPATLIALCAEAARILTPDQWRVAIVEARRLRALDARLVAGDPDVEPYEEEIDEMARKRYGDRILIDVDRAAAELCAEVLEDQRWYSPLSGGEQALAEGCWYTACVEALLGKTQGPYLRKLEPVRDVAIRAWAGGTPAVVAAPAVVWP